MSDTTTMVKKETLLYALLVGLVVGFIGGAVFASYKLSPDTSHEHPDQAKGQAPKTATAADKETAALIASLEAEVTADPKNVRAWTQLGHRYYDSAQPLKAIKAYRKSLELEPNNPDVLTDMGVMYRRSKQPRKAIESFEKAYSIDPNHEHARLNKGIVLLYDFNKPEEAIAAWEELLTINPQAMMGDKVPLRQVIDELREKIKTATPKE